MAMSAGSSDRAAVELLSEPQHQLDDLALEATARRSASSSERWRSSLSSLLIGAMSIAVWLGAWGSLASA